MSDSVLGTRHTEGHQSRCPGGHFSSCRGWASSVVRAVESTNQEVRSAGREGLQEARGKDRRKGESMCACVHKHAPHTYTFPHIPTLLYTLTHTHTLSTHSHSHTHLHMLIHTTYTNTHTVCTHTPQHAWDFSMMPKPQVGVKSRAHRPAGRCAESEQVSMQEGMTGREDLEMFAFLPSGNRQGTRGCLISSTSLPVSGVTDLLEIFVVTFLPRCSLTEQKAKASCDKWPEDCIFA